MKKDLYELIEKAKYDESSFRKLVDVYSPYAKGWCSRLTDNEEDLKDIAQEAFIKLYRDLPSLRDAGRFNSWFKRIVTNTAYDWFRKHKRKVELVYIENLAQFDETWGGSVNINEDDSELSRYVISALESLSSNNRIVFTLFYEQGKRCSEIAKMLNLSENAVKNRLLRAREHLREELSCLRSLNLIEKDKSFRILIICCSHKKQGVTLETAEKIKASAVKVSPASEVKIIQLSDYEIKGCKVCYECASLRKCAQRDGFEDIFGMCLSADVIAVVSPYYAPIPSRLSALLERLMAVSISPIALDISPGRAFPLQKKWCAVLNFSIIQQQGYIASVIREPLVSMGMGLIATEGKIPFDAHIFEHAELLGRLIVSRLSEKPDSNAIENWFDYWNEENIRLMDQIRKSEIERRMK
ncbi:MAG: sigma-70 family RNA polymerase sigma factor [Bacillota bacterium]